MHVNDIKAFAGKVVGDKAFAGKRVVIRAPQEKGGLYMSRRGFDAKDKKDARVFDYDAENVGQQVSDCMREGMPLEVELA